MASRGEEESFTALVHSTNCASFEQLYIYPSVDIGPNLIPLNLPDPAGTPAWSKIDLNMHYDIDGCIH